MSRAAQAAGPRPSPLGPRIRWSRWRAASLVLVHLLIAAHVVHWLVAGRTLAPLELNEVVYTLELGVVTAGFLLMVTALAATAVFGRFFCSWACHVLALQDGAAWLLERLGIRPKPVRSRTLALVPFALMAYMFIWPQVLRLIRGAPPPAARVWTDAEGWASFTTTDFWRNLPGPWVAGATFLVCGALMVYLLGSRSFCRHACPYGALFALADRIAPGRIMLDGDCSNCGACTAACQSDIRVHEELSRHGRVVDSACLKDLDCVSACPTGAVRFGFTRPALGDPAVAGARHRWRGVTRGEDVLVAGVFGVAVLSLRSLHDAVPLFLAVGLAVLLAYAAVLGLRLRRNPDVRIAPFLLRRGQRLTAAGVAFAGLLVLLAALLSHCAFLRWHEHFGARAFARLTSEVATRGASSAVPSLAATLRHLGLVERFGLRRSPRLHEMLAKSWLLAGRADLAGPHVASLRASDPVTASHLEGDLRALAGDAEGSVDSYRQAVAADATQVGARLSLGEALADAGRLEAAVAEFETVLTSAPRNVAARHDLAVVLTRLGREGEALEHAVQAALLAPSDPDVRNHLGYLRAWHGAFAAAEAEFRAALALRPAHAGAEFNLGRLRLQAGDMAGASAHFERAAGLDPRYAEALAAP